MTIAFIGFGEAGGILAADLAREHAVTMWDCKLNGPEREAMLRKARDSRVQVGNSLAQALFWRAKRDSLLRTQIKGAIIPGFLGIGEPLIYGVTLPRMKPFVTACLGGACGGFFVGLIAWLGLPVGLNTVFGPSGLVALPLMTSGSGIYAGMAVYAGGLAVSYLCGFVLTWLFGSKNVDLS